jgi:hypothetical protein
MRYRATETITVRTARERLTIPPGAVVSLNPEQAGRLLETGKIVPLLQIEIDGLDRYVEIFRRALAEIAICDEKGGALFRLLHDRPGAWAEIQAEEEKINRLWKEAKAGRPMWSLYEAAVTRWRGLFLRALQKSRERGLGGFAQ